MIVRSGRTELSVFRPKCALLRLARGISPNQKDGKINVPRSALSFANRIRALRARRLERTTEFKALGKARSALTSKQRKEILAKTGKRCHVCGVKIKSTESWHADHVLPHSGGGAGTIDNYLPSCATCNNYRWHMLPEEVQTVMKLGVFVRVRSNGVRRWD